MTPASELPIVLGITGASGAPYAVRLLQVLLEEGCHVHLAISEAGAAVIEQELGRMIDLRRFRLEDLLAEESGRGDLLAPFGRRVQYHSNRDLLAPIASGSYRTTGMVICPCSGGTLSAIATGASTNLIQRAADVHLKERRKLILVPRETPLSAIHLRNMQTCTEAGAIVLPAAPGFYHRPQTVQDLVDFVVARICDQLGVAHRLSRRWREEEPG